MKVGDLVKLKSSTSRDQSRPIFSITSEATGVILDVLEDEDGFYDYEVMFEDEIYWFRDLELEVVSESR